MPKNVDVSEVNESERAPTIKGENASPEEEIHVKLVVVVVVVVGGGNGGGGGGGVGGGGGGDGFW